MRHQLGSVAAAALCAIMPAGPAYASIHVLDFTGAACVGGACVDRSLIQTNYGSIAGQLNTIVSTASGPNSNAFYWSTGYGSLDGVAWTARGGSISIVLQPLAGFEVALNGFQAGCFAMAADCAQSRWSLTTLGGAPISGGPLNARVPTFTNIAVNSGFSSSGFRLLFGPDAFNTGIDNIEFALRAIKVAPGIPEPATWAMIISGFGLVGGVMRRTKVEAKLRHT